MAFTIADRVLDTTTSTASPFALSGTAPTGYKTFLTGIGNNNTCYYTIQNPANGEWETGTATLTGGTTLTRVSLIGSSTNSAVTFSAGTKYIFVALPASKNVYLDNSNVVNVDGDVTATSQNGGQLAGFRNRIINGACNVQQRAEVTNSAIDFFMYGGPDRFVAVNYDETGSPGVFTQSASSLTYQGVSKSAVRQTVNTAKTLFTTYDTWYGLAQMIEGYNCFDMLGKFATISFIFNTNLSGTYSVAIHDSNLANSYTSTFNAVANTPLKVTIQLSAVIPIDADIPKSNATGLIILVGYLAYAPTAVSTLNAWSASSNVMASTATNWAATSGNFIELTELQLEVGKVATPFERRPYGMEFAMCQRYYQDSGFLGRCTTTGAQTLSFNFPTMRAIPDLGAPAFGSAFTGATFSAISVSSLVQTTNNSAVANFSISRSAEL